MNSGVTEENIEGSDSHEKDHKVHTSTTATQVYPHENGITAEED